MRINPEAFQSDIAKFKEWEDTFSGVDSASVGGALPGGWGIGRSEQGWIASDGRTIETTVGGAYGPQEESTLLSTYPNCPPAQPRCFGQWPTGAWIPGCEEYYHGYVEACRAEYDYVAQGVATMAQFRGLLLLTLKDYYQWDDESKQKIDQVTKQIEEL